MDFRVGREAKVGPSPAISTDDSGARENHPVTAGFVTQDPQMLEIMSLVRQVADTDATVLIVGETGTGKELIARALHQQSSRCERPLLAVNCGAIAETLQESELFGHEKGAFTGANIRRIGKFPAADRGTIFLDEISQMNQALQVKLLRILQSGEFATVGTTINRYCDVRVVAAANEDLVPRIAAGEFRKDLYYRLNIIRIELPPLRQRRAIFHCWPDIFFPYLVRPIKSPESALTLPRLACFSNTIFRVTSASLRTSCADASFSVAIGGLHASICRLTCCRIDPLPNAIRHYHFTRPRIAWSKSLSVLS